MFNFFWIWIKISHLAIGLNLATIAAGYQFIARTRNGSNCCHCQPDDHHLLPYWLILASDCLRRWHCPQWSLSRKSDTWRRMKGLVTGILSRRIWRMARLGPIYSIITPGAGSCYYPDAGHSPHHHNGQHVQNQGFMTKPWLNFNQIEIYYQGQSAPSQNWCEIQFGTDIVHWLFNWRGRVETN